MDEDDWNHSVTDLMIACLACVTDPWLTAARSLLPLSLCRRPSHAQPQTTFEHDYCYHFGKDRQTESNHIATLHACQQDA